MLKFYEVDWDAVAASILGLVALAALIVGFAWMVHFDATNEAGCAHTLAGVKCPVVDASPQR